MGGRIVTTATFWGFSSSKSIACVQLSLLNSSMKCFTESFSDLGLHFGFALFCLSPLSATKLFEFLKMKIRFNAFIGTNSSSIWQTTITTSVDPNFIFQRSTFFSLSCYIASISGTFCIRSNIFSGSTSLLIMRTTSKSLSSIAVPMLTYPDKNMANLFFIETLAVPSNWFLLHFLWLH